MCRLLDVPLCILVGVLGLAVDIPLYTVIALIKSPYMLFKGWQRLLHDLISREGPFLETVCVPIAGLAILFWPLVVVGSVLLAVVSSIFVGLYGAVIVYQVAISATVALPCHFFAHTLRVQPRKRLSDVLNIVCRGPIAGEVVPKGSFLRGDNGGGVRRVHQ
jgi:hypothetical protein